LSKKRARLVACRAAFTILNKATQCHPGRESRRRLLMVEIGVRKL